MPWIYLPFGDRIHSKLHWHFQIKCVLTLIVIGPYEKFITGNGSCAVSIHGANTYPFIDSHLESLQRDIDEVARKYSGGLIGQWGLIESISDNP
jgi:hypothetical protein